MKVRDTVARLKDSSRAMRRLEQPEMIVTI
jgi:hypothetical protein